MLSSDVLIQGVSSSHFFIPAVILLFQTCHTDSNSGGLFHSACREASVSPLQITDHVQGHITHSEHPTRCSRLYEVVYE
jgi:hypothetical protein